MVGKGLAAFAAVYLGLVLVKDGTLPNLFNDAAKGASEFVRGIKPITNVA